MSKKKSRLSPGAIIIILIALAILIGLGLGWARCGLGKGDSDSEGGKPTPAADIPPQESAPADAPPATCRLSVASDGTVLVDGATKTIPDAVAHCRGAADVSLEVAGNAPFGAVDDLRKALEAAGLNVREP